jgi:hypothetical protein
VALSVMVVDSLSVTPDEDEWKEWVDEECFSGLEEREEGRCERWRAISEEGKEGEVEVEGVDDDDDAADLFPLGAGRESDSIQPPIAAPATATATEERGGVDEDDSLSLLERQKSSPDV